MNDLVDLGAARLDPDTNVLLVQAKTTRIGDDDDDAPDAGDAALMCALGVTALPWPANENGRAQGVKTDIPGTNGWITSARDTRTAKVVAEMGPGESSLHSTGPDFDSRFFAKDQLAAIVVGNDMAFNMDRKNKKATLSAFGGHIEVSEDGGCYMAHGGAMIQVKDGMIILTGKVVLGGRTPIAPVAMMVGGVPVPAPGVFVGG